MAHSQTPTLKLYPQGPFVERCLGLVDNPASRESVNHPSARALTKRGQLSGEATYRVRLAKPDQSWKRDPSATVGVLKVGIKPSLGVPLNQSKLI